MARPVKNNLDYFSHDKDMRNDLKIRNVRRKFGHKGYSVYVMMLEHLSDCNYLQYQWNEINIELLVPDFDVDYEELVDIVNHLVKLNLFEIEFGYIYSPKMLERHLQFMGERKSFDYNNSPIMKLKADLLSKSEINSVISPDNTQSKVKESKVKETKLNESKEKENKEKESIVNKTKLEESITEEMKAVLKKLEVSGWNSLSSKECSLYYQIKDLNKTM